MKDHEINQSLYEALLSIMEMVKSGKLVRDISGDADPDWAIKQVPLLLALRKADEALAAARGEA